MKSLLCFGEVLIDFLATPAAASEAPRAFLQFAGGAPANVAVAAARLGVPSEFVGMVGADMFGDFLVEALQQAGVGTGFVRRTDAAKTGLAFVQLDAHGERSFNFYRPPAADLLFRPADFSAHAFAAAGVLHVCSNSLTETDIAATTLYAAQQARAAGALVSADLNWRPMLWADPQTALPRLWQLLGAADIVKLARNEMELLAGTGDEEQVVQRLLTGQTQLLVLTDGAADLRWFTRQGRGVLPCFSVATRDTTAAGDAFVGGLLAALLRAFAADHAQQPTLSPAQWLGPWLQEGAALHAVLRYASAVGAIAVTRHGAFAAMPRPEEVQLLLERL